MMLEGRNFGVTLNPKCGSMSIRATLMRHTRSRGVLHSVYDGPHPSMVVVRNPWDRLVSCARFMGWHNDFEAWLHEAPTEMVLTGTVFDIARTPQWAWAEGATYVLRFENMAEDWAAFCASVGLPDLALHSVHRQAPVDYRTFYTDKTAAVVAERFNDDTERWGYSF